MVRNGIVVLGGILLVLAGLILGVTLTSRSMVEAKNPEIKE